MNIRKAVVIGKAGMKQFGGVSLQTLPVVIEDKLPADHVLVRMTSARINHVDMDLAQGLPFVSSTKPQDAAKVVGVDGSGTIVQVGTAVQQYKAGDNVLMYRAFTDFGTWSTHVSVPERFVAPAPKAIPLERAGAAALVAPTAYDSLFHSLQIEPGKTLLVLGARGGVGYAAVQFALDAGVKVIAYGGSRDEAKLVQAGCSRFIDYKTQDLYACLQPGDVDCVFDAAGKASLSELMKRLEPTKVCSIKHPNAAAMSGVGIELSWFWTTLLNCLAWWDNRTARAMNIELIGQVTPAGHPTLLPEVSRTIDKMGGFNMSYTTITLEDIEAKGGLTDKDIGRVITFD